MRPGVVGLLTDIKGEEDVVLLRSLNLNGHVLEIEDKEARGCEA